MKMRFDFSRLCATIALLLLTGSVSADPVREIFNANRDLILSQKVTTVADKIFTVGKAKSSRKAGDSIGYSKATMFAYGNIEVLNFNKAEWPNDITEEEKRIVWRRYRSQNPAKYTLSNGTQVHKERTEGENYLVVLAFPEDAVKRECVKKSALLPILTAYRKEIAEALALIKASETNTLATNKTDSVNRSTIAVTYDDLVNALMDSSVDTPSKTEPMTTPSNAARRSHEDGYSEQNGIKVNDTFDESLML